MFVKHIRVTFQHVKTVINNGNIEYLLTVKPWKSNKI